MILMTLHDALADDPNDNNTDQIDALKEDHAHFFLKKGILVLGGGSDSANEKTFSSANGQFDVPTDKNGGIPLDLKYGFGENPIVIIFENCKNN